MKKVLVIAGPTASGKTAFAIRMAKVLGGQIISGDSIQVYRGLDIGSGKVREEEKQGVMHHLIDILEPTQPYSAFDFQKMARGLIENGGFFPIIAGGTGLYLKACLYDYSFDEEDHSLPAADPRFESMSNEALWDLLLRTDPEQAKKLHPNNRRRVMRTLTIAQRSGVPQSQLEQKQNHAMIYDAFIAGCTMEREVLYERINRRVELMFEEGLVEEVKHLLDNGITFDDPGMKGIGYQEFRGYFEGTKSLEEVKEEIQKNSRHYAKRQYTWLRHQMPVHWFSSLEEKEQERMENEIIQWAQCEGNLNI